MKRTVNGFRNDLTGNKFGEWTVIKKGTKIRKWCCQCSCGIIKEVFSYHLLSGASTKCKKCSGTDVIELEIGSQYGDLTVQSHININGNTFAICKCKCDREIKVRPVILKSKDGSRSCKYCCGWKGYGEISSVWWSAQKRSAKERGLNFEITIEYIWDMYLKQDRKCNLSGTPIKFYRNPSKDSKPQTASLDRIDNDKGYTPDNVQLLHKKINFMKHVSKQEDFINYCKMIADKNQTDTQIENYVI